VCLCVLRVKKILWASESLKLEFHIDIDIELLPHSKHCLSVTKTNLLMLYQEILAAYCQNRTED
jgi:hypothetical protein